MSAATSMRVDAIAVEGRYRTELGDVAALAASIRELGLLHPLVVTSSGRLVAGQRRLAAVRQLGWAEVPVHVADSLEAAVALLQAERDENTCRKDMTPAELRALTDQLKEHVEGPAAKQRQREGQERGRAAQQGHPVSGPRAGNGHTQNEAEHRAAAAAGWSRTSYRRARAVLDAADDDTLPAEARTTAQQAAEQMNAGSLSIKAADRQVREARAAAATSSTGSGSGGGGKARPAPNGTPVRRSSPRQPLDKRVTNALGTLTGLVEGLAGMPEVPDVPAEEAARWQREIDGAIRSLREVKRKLKEVQQ